VATRHDKEGWAGARVGARNPRQGSMTRHRKITPAVGLCLALAVVIPGAAQASPILSGYGGPGQGNQAILGSALLNSPSGGGGGGSAGGGSGASGATGEIALPATTTSVGAARTSHGSASKQSPARGQSSPVGSSPQRAAQARVDAASAYLAAERGHPAGQSGALGLGGQDVLYIILALAALAMVAVFTRRLAQTAAAGTQR
jgi:hypothetical protein